MVKNLDHLQKEDQIHKELKFQNQNYLKSLKENQTAFDKLTRKNKILVLAGVFDGEGSFGVWSRGQNRPKRLEVKVETTDVDMVSRFHVMWGGIFFATTPKNLNHRHLFRWKVTGDKAWNCLKEMIPYMCLRRREKYYGLVYTSKTRTASRRKNLR